MRSTASRYLAGWLVATLVAAAHAQPSPSWTPVGPVGGTVTALVRSPANTAVLYAGSPRNGVFMSADAGRTWAVATSGLQASAGTASLTVRALVADGQYVYAATDTGLYVAPGGAFAGDLPQWQALAGPSALATPTMLAVDLATGRLFAASPGETTVYAMGLPAPGAAPSASWTASPLPGGVQAAGIGALAVVPASGGGSPLVLASAAERVFAAPVPVADAAMAWSDLDLQANLRATGMVDALHFAADFSQAYACSGGQLFAATNPRDPAANAWLALPVTGAAAQPPTCTAIASGALAAGAPAAVAVATSAGVYLSTSGTDFGAAAALPVTNGAQSVAMIGGATPLLVAGGNFGIATQPLASLAASQAWTAASTGLANARVVDSAKLGTTLYAAVADEAYAEVMASSDGGATWSSTRLADALGGVVPINALAADTTNSVLYAATDAGLFARAGSTWVAVAPATLPAVESIARGTSTLWLATAAGLRTLPLSASPASAAVSLAGFSGQRVSAVHVAGGKVFAALYDGDAGLSTAWVAADGSSPTWTEFATGPVATSRVTAFAIVGDALLAATRSRGVRIASAGGAWTDASNSPNSAEWVSDPNGYVVSLWSDGSTVFAATSANGLFAAAIGTPLRWVAVNGSGNGALGSVQMGLLRGAGSVLYAATSAGLYAFDGIAPTTPTPPVVPPTPGDGGGSGGGSSGSSSGGGGAFGFAWLAALGFAAYVLRRRR